MLAPKMLLLPYHNTPVYVQMQNNGAPLHHNNANTASLRLICVIPCVNAACDRRCLIVVEIVVKLAISPTELLLFEEEGIV